VRRTHQFQTREGIGADDEVFHAVEAFELHTPGEGPQAGHHRREVGVHLPLPEQAVRAAGQALHALGQGDTERID
jgi:hypothetical protein